MNNVLKGSCAAAMVATSSSPSKMRRRAVSPVLGRSPFSSPAAGFCPCQEQRRRANVNTRLAARRIVGDGPLGAALRPQLPNQLRHVIRRDAFVSADRLIGDVWGERPPASVRKALQMQISRLRRALGDPDGTEVLLTRDGAYRLCAAPESLDAAQFELLLSAARTEVAAGRVEEGRALFERALELWRGPAFADVAFEPSLRGEAERLEDLGRARARSASKPICS